MRNENSDTRELNTILEGIGVSPGIAIGPAYIYTRRSHDIEDDRIDESLVDSELQRLDEAVARSERDLKKIASVAKEKLGEPSADIFHAQLDMLRDEEVLSAISKCVRRDQCNAAYAVWYVLEDYRKRLLASDSEYFQERASDIADIADRIIRHLRREKFFSKIHRESIVFAENLSAADIVLFSRRGILGCVTDFGGATSHVSIMARALGLPAVVSTHGATDKVREGDHVILDGLKGKVFVNPDQATIDKYLDRRARYERLVLEQRQLTHLPAETVDGQRISLAANLEFRTEVPQVQEFGADGIGLFRTEVLFLMEGRLQVSEEEQFEEYKSIVESVESGITTFRVLDLGGDKMLPVAHREHNPFLGWRGVRILLDKPELLRPQLRALLRASSFGQIRILVPMISDLKEIRDFKAVLGSVMEEMDEEGIPFDRDIKLGAMVEVPSVAIMADAFAAEVDFFSLGTNDLTQYVLAVDRGNDLVAERYHELHPAVLRMIKATVDAGQRKGIPVSLCGEMGSNSSFVPILVGLGLKEISASPVYIPSVKRLIRAISFEEAQQLADEVLCVDETKQVVELLERWLRDHPFDLTHFLGDELTPLAANEGNGTLAPASRAE
ncbi:MAG: phosphoenolpyruvate--protein phosphotransferase [Rhodothermia bacterium]|nr:phosphoenolpyruvate--protein phosphotransferase [Rhodothermia bacterium]